MESLDARRAAPRLPRWPDRPIPISLVITDLDVGGAERALVQLATHLNRRRWAASVICLMDEGPLAAELRASSIPTACLGLRRNRPRTALATLRKTLAAQSPQLVQSFLFHANVATRLALPRRGGPWLIGGLRVAEHQRRWHLWLDKLTERRACGSVCVSEGVRRFVIRHARLDPDRLTVIPNGIDLERIDRALPADRLSLGLDPTGPIVLFVGRLDVQKGLSDLLEAWITVRQAFPQATLLLVGDGPERQTLSRWLAAHPGSRVRALGFRPDVPSLMLLADLFVLPSLWEGMPNVVMEAMAARLPVVATRVEGTEDLVIDGQTGWLVPPRRPDLLAAAVRAALDDPEASRRRGALGRSRVEQQFSLDATVRAYESLWADVLGLPDPAASP
ncbi:MAG: glycosyl transferase [Isosphaeraceae bacterium]|nr:MAG: glycosyl transferase [Isosphaeraceae bacterium]